MKRTTYYYTTDMRRDVSTNQGQLMHEEVAKIITGMAALPGVIGHRLIQFNMGDKSPNIPGCFRLTIQHFAPHSLEISSFFKMFNVSARKTFGTWKIRRAKKILYQSSTMPDDFFFASKHEFHHDTFTRLPDEEHWLTAWLINAAREIYLPLISHVTAQQQWK